MTQKPEKNPAGTRAAHAVRCWDRLCAATGDRKDPWRTPSLATSGPNGPEVRTVVLRAVNPDSRQLDFHTDARSAKARQLETGADVAWMFYDRSLEEQLRCRGSVQLHRQDAIALDAWEQLHPGSRAPYAQASEPGKPWLGTSPPLAVSAAATNFMLVRCTVRHMDWLQLGASEHVRIVMHATDSGWTSQRVAP